MNQYGTPPAARIVGFFHGIDLATQNDYYTDVIHVLPEKPQLENEAGKRYTWNPFLCGIMRLKKMEPNEMIDTQIKTFNKFPPFNAQIDSSREEFLANAMLKKYGESIITPVKFLNQGATNIKFDLKQIGYSYLHAGYQWPDDIKIEKIHPRLAKLIRILKKEMIHEQVQYTQTGRLTFNEPIGKHNDLVHGWELSLKGVMEFQEKNLGYELRKPENPAYATITDEIYADYEEEETVPDEIYEKGAGSYPF